MFPLNGGEKSDCAPILPSTESLGISYRGDQVSEINLIGDISFILQSIITVLGEGSLEEKY